MFMSNCKIWRISTSLNVNVKDCIPIYKYKAHMIVDFTESERKKYAYTDDIRSWDLLNLLDPQMIEGLDMLRGSEATLKHHQGTICRESSLNHKVVYMKYNIMTEIISSCH